MLHTRVEESGRLCNGRLQDHGSGKVARVHGSSCSQARAVLPFEARKAAGLSKSRCEGQAQHGRAPASLFTLGGVQMQAGDAGERRVNHGIELL